MATATMTSLKNWICAASNFIALIPSRLILRMLPKFFWSWNLKDYIKVQEKKKKVVVFCSPSSTKREIRQFHVVVVQRRQRNVQKSVMHVQSCCFACLNLILFCRSRCRRRRRCVNSLLFHRRLWGGGRALLPSPQYITVRCPKVWPLLFYSHSNEKPARNCPRLLTGWCLHERMWVN